MTTVVHERGFRVRILAPPREHGPPHAHVVKGRGEVLVDLEPVSIKEIRGQIKNADVVTAVRLVEKHLGALLQEWRRLHGK